MSREGGNAQCSYCHAPLAIAGRDDTTVPRSRPQLRDAERYQGLWTQSAQFGEKQIPMEMVQIVRPGPLTPDRLGPALALWRVYCQRASMGDIVAGDLAVLLTAPLSGYFVTQNDPQRQRRSSRRCSTRSASRSRNRSFDANWREPR